ncbi:uncharacterized protein LOC112001969 [Quercus suber]|uniref:uncharacterized protein LOC112001969 n=1 Tax=Quercus suber TaxID=58331 RepID=UPI0032DE73EB
MAFVINEIWYLRNQVLNHCVEINTKESFKRVRHKLNEYSALFTKEDAFPNSAPPPAKWEAPPHRWIKLNVDTTLSNSSFALAVVAREIMGDIIKIWSKIHTFSSPIVAEASAILWAAQLAHEEDWNHIIIEGDAKNCFDPLSLENVIPD